MAQSKPNLDPIVAFSTATNQQEAMEAIRRLEQTNLSSALDARAMMTPCRLISQTPNYLGSSIDSWHKSGLIEYCRGHDDPGASESIRRSREEGTKAQILQKLRSIEEVQGIEAALAQLQEMLKTEQDPFAVQALFEYLAVSNRSGNEALFDRALRGFPLSAGVPRDVLGITSQLAYCEMSGGCGPYHLITLDACAVAGRCPPGASYRDFYALTVPPVWMQDVDTVLARWHSLRRCGRYQCGP